MKRILFFCVTTALVTSTFAQDAKASKEREALRRAQTALRAAQEQQTALQTDKAKAEADAVRARKESASARTQIASTLSRVQALEADLDKLKHQLQTARQTLQDTEAQAASREQTLQQQLLNAQHESASRLQANLALTQLLERSTLALKAAETTNQQLHTMGHDLLKRWSSRSNVDAALMQDPILGWTAVRTEDEAEKLRIEWNAKLLAR